MIMMVITMIIIKTKFPTTEHLFFNPPSMRQNYPYPNNQHTFTPNTYS